MASTGTPVSASSLQLEQATLHAQVIGNEISKLLSDRSEIDIPVAAPFTIYSKSGMVPESTPIQRSDVTFHTKFSAQHHCVGRDGP